MPFVLQQLRFIDGQTCLIQDKEMNLYEYRMDLDKLFRIQSSVPFILPETLGRLSSNVAGQRFAFLDREHCISISTDTKSYTAAVDAYERHDVLLYKPSTAAVLNKTRQLASLILMDSAIILELIQPAAKTYRHVLLPGSHDPHSHYRMTEITASTMLVVSSEGRSWVLEAAYEQSEKTLQSWRKMLGQTSQQAEIESDDDEINFKFDLNGLAAGVGRGVEGSSGSGASTSKSGGKRPNISSFTGPRSTNQKVDMASHEIVSISLNYHSQFL